MNLSTSKIESIVSYLEDLMQAQYYRIDTMSKYEEYAKNNYSDELKAIEQLNQGLVSQELIDEVCHAFERFMEAHYRHLDTCQSYEEFVNYQYPELKALVEELKA